MATENRFKMSQERLDALKKELLYLETDKAKEVAEQIKEARSFGDLSENSEYDEAKTEQGKLYSRIAELKSLVENAEIVEKVDTGMRKGAVTLGSRVKVRDLDDGYEEDYTIVGSQEANPWKGAYPTIRPLDAASTVTSQARRSPSMHRQVSCTLRYFR